MRWSSTSLDGYGSKIGKVSRYRPAVSNKTILATKQEFFFTKVAPVQNVYFILHYHFFFVKKFIFSNVYTSVNIIFECKSLLSKLIFTHTVSCGSNSHEIVEK